MRKLSQKELDTVAGAAPSSVSFSSRVSGGGAVVAGAGVGNTTLVLQINDRTIRRSGPAPFAFGFSFRR